MQAKIIYPFKMGDKKYLLNEIVDLPEDRVKRLVGERLVCYVQPDNDAKPDIVKKVKRKRFTFKKK